MVENVGSGAEVALKECPFCGGKADRYGWLSGEGDFGPECETCGATAASVEAWNRRALPAGWIPVSEGLPEERIKVLVCSTRPEDGPTIAALITKRSRKYWFFENHIVDFYRFTHWQSLPEAP